MRLLVFARTCAKGDVLFLPDRGSVLRGSTVNECLSTEEWYFEEEASRLKNTNNEKVVYKCVNMDHISAKKICKGL